MAADVASDVGGVGVAAGEAGEAESGVGGAFAAGVVGGVALDEERVRGVGEVDGRVAEELAQGCELDGAAFAAAVAAAAGDVGGDFVPGQGVEQAVETVLVLLDGENVVRAAGVQVAGVFGGGVQGVGR
ncbi:hypothetical protein [Amycolatopsis mediterranei]|uniref:hypothetical protein n=1 Tax=Amycolatopsis mediterranei TaxID=33910 RepID=UPI001E420752|nr:hypothetical protein [Amycolatopsis mediterranei]